MSEVQQPADPWANLPAQSSLWGQEWDTAAAVESHDLIDNKTFLVGVPFLITRAVYREGKYAKPGAKPSDIKPDYVSVEAVIAPAHVLRRLAARGKLDPRTFPFEPEELVVFNDKSTGVYRQVTEFLHRTGAIVVNKPNEELVTEGKYGVCHFDRSRHEWHEGSGAATDGIDLRLRAPRGLRVSQYENEFNPDSETFYLA